MSILRVALLAVWIVGPATACKPSELAAVEAPAPRPDTGGRPTVLLPADPALRRSARVMETGAGHTVTAEASGLTVQITGLPAPPGEAPLYVQRTEYGVDASFGRAGALYNVTLTCAQAEDRRCTDESFLRTFIAGLSPR